MRPTMLRPGYPVSSFVRSDEATVCDTFRPPSHSGKARLVRTTKSSRARAKAVHDCRLRVQYAHSDGKDVTCKMKAVNE